VSEEVKGNIFGDASSIHPLSQSLVYIVLIRSSDKLPKGLARPTIINCHCKIYPPSEISGNLIPSGSELQMLCLSITILGLAQMA
jgi:hypothetical protein